MLALIWCLLVGVSLAWAQRPSGWGSVSPPASSSTKYSTTTTKGFSTVIPCPYCDNTSVATVTCPEQTIPVSRSTSTKTVVAVTTSYRHHGRPIPKVETATSYSTVVREWNALYKDLGPLAIADYLGNDLCRQRCHGPNDEVLQVVQATECQSTKAAAPVTCSAWEETWMFQPSPTRASTAKAVVTSSAVTLPATGVFTFPFINRAPPATFDIPARTITYTSDNPEYGATTVTVTVSRTSIVFASREWTTMVTQSCTRPTVIDLTVTMSTTLIYTMPPFTPPSRPTPVPVPTNWDDWVAPSTSAAPISTSLTSSIYTSSTSVQTSTPASSPISPSASSSAPTTLSTSTGSSSSTTTTTATETFSSTSTSACNSATATAASGPAFDLYYHGAGNMSVRAVELTWMYNGSLPVCDAAALCAQAEINLRGNAPSSFDVVKWLNFEHTWYCNLYLNANSDPNAFRKPQSLIIDAYGYNWVPSTSSSVSTSTGTSTSAYSTSSAIGTSSSLSSSSAETTITTTAQTSSTVTATTSTTVSPTTATCSAAVVTASAGQGSSPRFERYFYGTGVQVPSWQPASPLPDATDACGAIQLCANSQASINTEDGIFVVAWDKPSQQWQCFTHAVGTSAANPQAFAAPDANVGAVYAYGLDVPLPSCYHFTVNETSFALYYTGSGNMDSRTPTGTAVLNATPSIPDLCGAIRWCADLLYGQNPEVGDFDVYVARGQPNTWHCDVYAGDAARDTSVYSVGSNDVIRMYGYTSQ